MNDTLQVIGAESRLWRAATWVLRTATAAWGASRVGRAVRSGLAAGMACSPGLRVRFVAAVVAWAGVWHLAGLWVLPSHVVSGLPRIWFMAALAGAIVVFVIAEPLVAAWPESRVAKYLCLAD